MESNELELYHHGILGQKWGVRRYQNKDGSLTSAGRKKYGTVTNFNKVQAAKKRAEGPSKEQVARAKANARTQKEIDKYNKKAGVKSKTKTSSSSDSKPKIKSISEMSDDEIRSKINRIKLENELKSLTPQQVSKGKKFVSTMLNDVIAPAAKNVGKQFAEKKMKEMLGLDEKEAKDASKELQKMAQEYENRQKIDKGQQYFKEGKYSESKSDTKTSKKKEKQETKTAKKEAEDAKREAKTAKKEAEKAKQEAETAKKEAEEYKRNSEKAEKVYGDGKVYGEGTSKYRKSESTIIDADWSEVSSNSSTVQEYAQIGSSYLNQFLLEDKKK